MTFITLGFENNVITDGTFITVGSKCLLQMGPLLHLGPVITLVPSTVHRARANQMLFLSSQNMRILSFCDS